MNPQPSVTPERIIQMAWGYAPPLIIETAINNGVFDALNAAPKTAARADTSAAREVWKPLGVPDRMGVTEESTCHCQWHPGFTPAIEPYLDKFLLGNQEVDTDILRSKFTAVDRAKGSRGPLRS